MSLRQKYLRVLSQLMPTGAVGVSLLLGAAPGDAAQHPFDSQPAAADRLPVAERLAAIRQAVSDIAGDALRSRSDEQQLAWGNWWRNGGWRNGGWRNGGWRNGGWGNWHNGWHNGWPNWWHNW
jgi:rSAM-associated Gly-rich repeat protein